MRTRQTLSTRAFMLILVLVSVQAIVFIVLSFLFVDLNNLNKRAFRDTLVMDSLSNLYLWAVDLMQLRSENRALAEGARKKKEVLAYCTEIKQLLKEDDSKRFKIQEFEDEIIYLYSFAKADQSPSQFRHVAKRTELLWAKLRQLKSLSRQESTEVHDSFMRLKNTRDAAITALGVFIVLQIILIAAAIWLIRRDIATRLNMISDNINRFARNEKLHPIVSGDDEIADLDKAFHRMASAVQFATDNKRDLVDNASDVVCRISRHRDILSINDACRTVFGYEPDELVLKKLQTIVPPENLEDLRQQLRNIREGRENHLETRIIKKDAGILDTLWSVRWSPESKSYFCVVHDVTIRKRADRLRQEVLQMVSHDLRSPLATVSSFLDMAIEGYVAKLNEEGTQKVASASFATVQMVELINSLLDIEKIEAGMLELEKEIVPLSEIFIETYRMLESTTQELNIELEFSETDLKVYADRDRLLQVVEKLVSDAARCSPAGSKVMIDAQMVDEFVEVKVIDEGKKISDHLQEIMFDVFAQARLKDARDQRGAGIGLAVCKSLIELHNGIIGSEHREGYNIFSFCLPSRSGISMHTERDLLFITQKLSRLKSARSADGSSEDSFKSASEVLMSDDEPSDTAEDATDDTSDVDEDGTAGDSTNGTRQDDRPQFDTISGTEDTTDDGLSGGTS